MRGNKRIRKFTWLSCRVVRTVRLLIAESENRCRRNRSRVSSERRPNSAIGLQLRLLLRTQTITLETISFSFLIASLKKTYNKRHLVLLRVLYRLTVSDDCSNSSDLINSWKITALYIFARSFRKTNTHRCCGHMWGKPTKRPRGDDRGTPNMGIRYQFPGFFSRFFFSFGILLKSLNLVFIACKNFYCLFTIAKYLPVMMVETIKRTRRKENIITTSWNILCRYHFRFYSRSFNISIWHHEVSPYFNNSNENIKKNGFKIPI